MSSVLKVDQLTKIFQPEKKGGVPFVAVNNISFEMEEGEVLGLLGPNGAGKSTTISMLLDTLSPTSGSIEYFGMDFNQHRSQILEQVTFASTYVKLPWRLTVMENLRVYALLYGVGEAEFQKRAKRFLEFFEVWNQKDKVMSQLSAGQITRIMLAKAFIPYPKVVLLDEPTASLDPDIAHQVRHFVREQQKEFGTTILYTSHNMDEVAEVCDRVMFLRGGEIVAVDQPEKLAQSISIAHLRLQVKDGLKRTAELADRLKLKNTIDEREIVIQIDEHKIADFLNKLAHFLFLAHLVHTENPMILCMYQVC
jgi:ABC-2 type transport system ATP-binding protein